MKQKLIKIVFAVTLLVPIFNLQAVDQTRTYESLSKTEYYDKTMGCILGQIGGFLTGFEFVKLNGAPYIGLPDEWFNLCYGPYGGGPKHGSAGESCVEAYGKILQDDDYHVDFFNQLIFDSVDHLPTSYDIMTLWKKHQVRDWGGGYKALEIMNRESYTPPFCGSLEYGNIFSWCSEPYIENETVGCIVPGMAQTADLLTERFALTTGEYESVLWARFYGVIYSVAYFEHDAVVALKKAAEMLPKDSQAWFIYNKAKELYNQYPDDWRTAAKLLATYGQNIFLLDNVCVAYDINGGFTVLSILYGKNDYLESVRIASLIGYDGDCTAATVCGLMGIIHGLEGTPDKIKEVIYHGGDGELINDGRYVPYIQKDYPERQKFTEIASLYQKNAEKVIKLLGGKVDGENYLVPIEEVKRATKVVLVDRGFEGDASTVKTLMLNGAQGGVDKNNSFTAHSGNQVARILSRKVGAEGKVYIETSLLEIGKYYKVSGYLVSKGINRAGLFVENGDQFLTSTSYNNTEHWFCRSIVFEATESEAKIGLYMPPTVDAELFNCYLDDITIKECNYNSLYFKEAEDIEERELCQVKEGILSGASDNQCLYTERLAKINNIKIIADRAGEYMMRIRFANPNDQIITGRILSNGVLIAKIPFYQTGKELVMEENVIEVPLQLKGGSNQLAIQQILGNVYIDWIEVVEDLSAYAVQNTNSSIDKEIGTQKQLDVSVSNETLIVYQKASSFTQATIYTLTGSVAQQFALQPQKTIHPLRIRERGVYILACMGNGIQEFKKFIY